MLKGTYTIGLLAMVAAIQPAAARESWKDAIAESARLQEAGRGEQAEQRLRAVLEQGVEGRLPVQAEARLHHDLGSLSQDRHSPREAMQHYRRAIAAWEQAGPRYQLHLSSTLSNLACLLWEEGRLSEASRTLQRAVAIQRAVNVPNSELPRILYNLSSLHFALGRESEGRAVLAQVAALRHDGQASGSLLNIAAGNLSMGNLLEAEGKAVEAQRYHQRGLALWAEWRAAGGRAIGNPGLMTDVAVALSKGPAPLEALGAVDLLLSWIDRQGSAAGPQVVPALRAAAQVLRQAKRGRHARALERRAKAVLAANREQLAQRRHQVDVLELRSVRARR